MVRILIILIILLTHASGLYAQFWERTGGPGGDQMLSADVSPAGDIFILSQSIHRSSDAAATWLRLAPDIQISGSSHAIKLAWSNAGTMFMLMQRALWKSSDNGNSWARIKQLSDYPGLATSPRGHLIVAKLDSVLVSSDDGVTWTSSAPASNFYGGDISVDKDGVIYIAISQYLYRSTNNGATWSKIINGLPIGNYPSHIYSARHGLAIASVGAQVYTSVDSGRVWSLVYNTLYNIRSICAVNEDTVFLLTDNRILHRSTDGGATWSQYNTLEFLYDPYYPVTLFSKDQNLFILFNTTLYRHDIRTEDDLQKVDVPTGNVFHLAAASTGDIFAGTSISVGSRTGRFWKFDAEHWDEGSSFYNNDIHELAVDSSDALFAIVDARFKASSNGGKNWIEGIYFGGSQFRMSLTKDFVYVATGSEGVFRSSDHGATWDQLNTGITNLSLFSIAASDGVAYAGGLLSFYRSTNNGWTWEAPIFPFIGGSGVVRAIDCTGPNVVVGIDQTGAYFSSDHGITWENHSTGLALDTINRILMTPSGAVFAATSSGVYEYTPSTQTWASVNDNMLGGNILSLALNKDGRLYAGTDGDGVYRTTKTYGSWFKSVQRDGYSPNDISIYPNPASSEITLNFRSDKPEKYRIDIYNLLGESILVSSDEGTIDVSALGSGQYFLRVLSDEKIQTLPLSIIR
jgi:photosystem II stability/assembly factor-like uncharacterized protein